MCLTRTTFTNKNPLNYETWHSSSKSINDLRNQITEIRFLKKQVES